MSYDRHATAPAHPSIVQSPSTVSQLPHPCLSVPVYTHSEVFHNSQSLFSKRPVTNLALLSLSRFHAVEIRYLAPNSRSYLSTVGIFRRVSCFPCLSSGPLCGTSQLGFVISEPAGPFWGWNCFRGLSGGVNLSLCILSSCGPGMPLRSLSRGSGSSRGTSFRKFQSKNWARQEVASSFLILCFCAKWLAWCEWGR